MTVKEWCETETIITENKKSATYWWLKHILGNADKQMCIKFLCKHEDGTERDMVEPAFWKDNAVRFQCSLEFQAVLEKNYEEGR